MLTDKKIIKKLTLDVETSSMAQALHMKDTMGRFLEQYLYPQLDQIFSESNYENTVVEIPHINLEINVESGEDWKVLSKTIVDALKKNLPHSLEKASRKTLPEKTLESLIFFLRNGRYPWSYTAGEAFDDESIKALSQSKKLGALEETLRTPEHLKRLIFQFENNALGTLFNGFEGNDLSWNVPTPRILKNLTVKERFWTLLFSQRTQFRSLHFIQDFSKIIEAYFQISSTSNKKQYLLKKSQTKVLLELLRYCNNALKIPISLEGNTKDGFRFWVENTMPLQERSFDVFENQKLFIKKSHDFPKEQLEKEALPNKAEALEEGLKELIPHAGLVLLHPFLNRFFEHTAVSINGKIPKEKWGLATHLLYYLATQKEHPEESLLVFEKYLCGIPQKYPIQRFISLTNEQKEACETLLQAVLTHWSSLKTQNTQVLRNEFLNREGKLETLGEKDTLYIERKTQDILLEQIPWSLHMIKFPWKKKLLFVDW